MRSRLWAEVSLANLLHNVRTLQARFGPLIAVVKANAYGHGLIPVARTCAQGGMAAFGVATLGEALALRRAGISQPIYALAQLLPEEAEDAIRADITPFISAPEFFDSFVAAAAHAPLPARCFLVVDTGMGREGLPPDDARRLWEGCPESVSVQGFSTHLASADEDELAPTVAQTQNFEAFIASLGEQATGLVFTVSNSPALLRGVGYPLGRVGLALYGIAPYPGALDGTDLRPILALKARLTLVKDLPTGATVGYGRTYTLTRPSRIATVPVGYGDGWLRALSNRGEVLVRGVRCPMVGRVSMDQTQIDVTDVPGVGVGETVTLIGEGLPADEVASWAQTTTHEVTTQLMARVERVYTASST